MANLNEAYEVISKPNTIFNNKIEHFFNQRTVMKEFEYIDKNMIRKSIKKKVIENFLSVRIPSINNNTLPHTFDIDIFGNIGYHYTGTVITTRGRIPDFSINIDCDSKIFVHIKDNNNDTSIKPNYYTAFIDVPKRYRHNIKTDNIIEEQEQEQEQEQDQERE